METKKIISSLLAAGMALSSMQVSSIAADVVSEHPITTESADEVSYDKDFVSSVKIIGQTDNSISIEWSSFDKIKSYSVIVNDKIVAENIETTNYTINGLESAEEYFIVVQAYDESGMLLFTGNELRAHTNLTVNSNYTLTKDVNAANVYINGGTFDLNGHSLVIDNDMWITSGH